LIEANSIQSLIKQNQSALFKELDEEIENENVTDIEWDGYQLWITDLTKGCYVSDKKLTESYVENMAIRLANIMRVPFNRAYPVLEANTDELRISIWHESRCGKKSVTIRKIPRRLRFAHETLVETGYAPEELVNLIENCVLGHCNCVIGGQPHAGKTELLKYMSTWIPANEKVGVYEDNQEIHYRMINPGKKCAEFYVDDKFSYSQIIKAGLRHNIDWLLLSESRGPEVVDLLNSLSTGAYCMTTMHLDQVESLPDRMYNMLGESNVSERFMNSIYQYIDLGIVVECDKNEHRKITQVGFFSRENGINTCTIIYDNGTFTRKSPPKQIQDKFNKYGITEIYEKTYI